RCNFRIPGFCSSAVGILIVPTQASILSRCRAPRCDRRPVRPKRNPRKRLENNLRTSGEKIVTRYRKHLSELADLPVSAHARLPQPLNHWRQGPLLVCSSTSTFLVRPALHSPV